MKLYRSNTNQFGVVNFSDAKIYFHIEGQEKAGSIDATPEELEKWVEFDPLSEYELLPEQIKEIDKEILEDSEKEYNTEKLVDNLKKIGWQIEIDLAGEVTELYPASLEPHFQMVED